MRDPRKMFFLWERHSSYILLDCSDRKIILIDQILLIFQGMLWFTQFSSVAQLCPTLCYPMNHSMPASLSITNSWSSPKLMSTESVMPSNHLISVVPFSSHPQSFPASGSFQMSQLFASSGQSIGVSASTSVLLMNTQDWSPLGWTGWISLQSKGHSRVFSNTTVQKHQFFGTQLLGEQIQAQTLRSWW